MSLERSLLLQLSPHFQQCYQYLPSYVKEKNVVQCDNGPLEFTFIINNFGNRSP